MPQHIYSASRLSTRLFCGLWLAALLAACGGGGGNGETQPAANQPPIAQVLGPSSVASGSEVTLDGGGSRDIDGSISRYQWRQTQGPTVAIVGEETATARFTAPTVGADTVLAFSLSVTDNQGASASASASITVTGEAVSRWDLSGTVLASSNQAVDGDTNDTASLYTPNDTPGSAQALANPVTLGGYINQPGTGAEGRSQLRGDIDDYFRLELLAAQSVTLLVAGFEDADADLYLYNEAGEVIDFSVETGEIETVTAPENGTYLVNVTAFLGATNYILAVGSPALDSAPRTDAELVPGEIIVEFAESEILAPGFFHADLAYQMGMQERAGGPGRARLLEILAGQAERQRLGTAARRIDDFQNSARRERWETLISVKQLRQQPDVRHVEPNYRLHTALEPNDSAYDLQWHYPLIGLPAAWDVTIGDPGVVVAVIDTGILSNHPDLAGQLVAGYDFVRDPAADGDGIDPDPEDPGNRANPGNSRFHGTHVAGTVAARGNNRIGVSGVAWGARVMPLRALDDGGGTSYDVAQAVRFAAGLANDSGTFPPATAAIINLSLSGEGFSQMNQALYRELRERGTIVVASAGNEATRAPAYPAAYDGVISVAAVDLQREIASYSNRGSSIDISAPGGDGSTDFNGDGYPDGILSTGGSADAGGVEFAYTFLNGTSMAAPHVSGVIALMKSINPQLDGPQLESLLQSGNLTDDLGSAGRDDLYGHGLVNARKAVEAALASIGETFTPPATLRASSQSLNFGGTREQLDITLSNGGSGNLQVLGLDSDASWLSVSALEVDTAGLGRYRLQVDRSGLADGLYSATVSARSSANSLQIRALLSVGDAAVADVGVLYIIVYDPATDAAIAQSVARAEAGRYAFRFQDLPDGTYQVFAGTDADNDLFICDAGEACGAWLTTDEPGLIVLDRDRDALDFPVEHFIRLPSGPDANANVVSEFRGVPRER